MPTPTCSVQAHLKKSSCTFANQPNMRVERMHGTHGTRPGGADSSVHPNVQPRGISHPNISIIHPTGVSTRFSLRGDLSTSSSTTEGEAVVRGTDSSHPPLSSPLSQKLSRKKIMKKIMTRPRRFTPVQILFLVCFAALLSWMAVSGKIDTYEPLPNDDQRMATMCRPTAEPSNGSDTLSRSGERRTTLGPHFQAHCPLKKKSSAVKIVLTCLK